MRNMMLEEMLTDLRHEARISSDAAHGTHLGARHTALLRRVQEHLAMAHEWPELNVIRSVSASAGQRYVAYPDQIDYSSISEVYIQAVDGDWYPIKYGVHLEHLNMVDSDANEQRDDPLRWEHYLGAADTTIAGTMFEIWPIPNRAVNIRFVGQRKLLPLNVPADRSTLDGPMIVMFAAAELLAAQKADDASLKFELARERMRVLKMRQNNPTTEPVNFARGITARSDQRFRTP